MGHISFSIVPTASHYSHLTSVTNWHHSLAPIGFTWWPDGKESSLPVQKGLVSVPGGLQSMGQSVRHDPATKQQQCAVKERFKRELTRTNTRTIDGGNPL